MTVSEELAERVLRRARHRCEYCQGSLLGAAWQVDHIIAQAQGGSDGFENLAAACYRCNLNKGAKLKAVDPLLGRRGRLFDPRADSWARHFARFRFYTVGTTSLGRRTAGLLFRHTPRQVAAAPPPSELGSPVPEPLVTYFSTLYGDRKLLAFDRILRAVDPRSVETHLGHLARASGPWTDQGTLVVEQACVLAEAFTSRSLIEDLLLCDSICARAILACRSPSAPPEMTLRLSYLRHKRQLAWRQIQHHAVLAGRGGLLGGGVAMSVGGIRAPTRPITTRRWIQAIRDAEQGSPVRLHQSVDRLIADGDRRMAERLGVLQTLTRLVGRSGYGMDADWLYGVLLVRRLLEALLKFDARLLPADADRHLTNWDNWGASHQLRVLSLHLGSLDRHSSAGDLAATARDLADTDEWGEGAEREIGRRLKRLREERELPVRWQVPL